MGSSHLGLVHVSLQSYSPDMRDDPGQQPARSVNRRVLHVTCTTHSGPSGFTNLAVSKRDGDIEFDPHVTGQCVIVLDETAATALFDALGEWLG